MDGPQLVHVVALVGAASGVHEGEHAGDKKGALVVGNGERAGKDCAGLAVFPVAVGEEERIRCAVAVPQMAALPHEATRDGGVVLHGGAAADDEIIGNDSMADANRSDRVTHHAAVAKPVHTADNGSISDPHPVDIPGVADTHITADASALRTALFRILVDERVQPLRQPVPMPVHCQHISHLSAQTVENLHFATAGFVEHRHLHAVSETAHSVVEHKVHILYIGIVADVVVGDVVGHVFDERIVAHRNVMQRGVAHARMLLQASGEGELLLEPAKGNLAGEMYIINIIEGLRAFNLNRPPVFTAAAPALQDGYFFFRKISHIKG